MLAYAENGRKYSALCERINDALFELEQLNSLKDEVVAELHDIRRRENEMFEDMSKEGIDVDSMKANIMEYIRKISDHAKG